MQLDNGSEGSEGVVITPKKQLLNLDESRCTNMECELRLNCARFLQFTKDLKSNYTEPYTFASYTKFKPENGVCEFKIEINE